MAGRPQESARTGPTYRLAEYLNANWDDRVGRTNEAVAMELGYKASNLISMWRTGKTRIPLEKLPDIARLMKIDIAMLLPLWFEQQWGNRSDVGRLKAIFDRFATVNEGAVLSALRAAAPAGDAFTSDTIKAIVAVVTDPAIRADVIKKLATA
jgi:hypothetical protein